MPTPIESLDAFLEGTHQRDLTRVVRLLLSKGHGLTVAYGNGPAAERLVATLARTHPEDRAHLALIEVDPVRLTMAPQSNDPRTIEGGPNGPTQFVRSLLRQDPDAIALTRLEDCEAQLLVSAVFTGHQLLLGSSLPTLEAVVAALAVGSEGLDGHIRSTIDLACEFDEHGRLRRVFRGDKKGGVIEVARIEGGLVVTEPSLQPEPEPAPRAPRLAPPLESLPVPTRAPRVAFLPQTSPGVTGRSLLGTRVAHRPLGTPWPACRDCGRAMTLIIQLDLSALPAPMPASPGLAQLFLCTAGGCEVTNETSKGVLAEVLTSEALESVAAPASMEVEVLEPGTIVGWRRFEEDPESQDLERLGLVSGEDEELPRPLRADKLGGWPCWEQGMDWPSAEHELLFQFAEESVLAGGTPDTWDEVTATRIVGQRPHRVLDPNQPCHFPSVLTAEAVAFLFWEPKTRHLALRWQTG